MPGPIIKDPTPEWLKAKNASVLDPTYKKIARTLADILGITDPQSQVVGMMTPLVPEGQAMVSKPLQKAAGTLRDLVERAGIKAFHGSPHDFDKFSLSKIGTGEGAQAYGHGLYFAEDQKVANTYRGKVSAMQGGKPTVDGRPINWDDPREGAAFELWRHNGDRQAAADFAERTLKKGSSVPEILRSGEPLPNVLPPGRMYEVQINADPDQLLDWDKPLSQQSGQVQSAAQQLIEQAKRDAQANNRYAAQALLESKDYVPADPTGADIHRILSRTMNDGAQFNQTTVSKALREQGIPGIKYLDGGSRAAGEGSRNFVIFDDSLIDILKKYGVALPVIEGLRRKANAQGGKLRAEDVQAVF